LAIDRSTHSSIEDMDIREVKASGDVFVNAIVDKIGSVKDPAQ
jgi:hypothetical protein